MTSSHTQLSQLPAPRQLVWLQTGFIGDIVLSTGAIELAGRMFPGTTQHIVTTPMGAEMFSAHPLLQSVHVFDKRGRSALTAFSLVKRSLFDSLRYASRSSSFDASYLMQIHTSYRSSLLSFYLGLPRIIFKEASLKLGARARVDRVAVFHECGRQAMLLEPLGVRRSDIAAATPKLYANASPLSEEWTKWFDTAGSRESSTGSVTGVGGSGSNSQGKIVAIAPGSVWGTKRWPRAGYTTVARWLLTSTNAGILFLGSKAEAELCQSIVGNLSEAASDGGSRILNLAGKTTLSQLMNIYPRVSALVANDSSAIHFASGFNVPTVGVFGATIPQMGFAPLAPGSHAVGIALDCRPCSDHGPQTCPLGHFRCMRDLSPDLVIDALKRML